MANELKAEGGYNVCSSSNSCVEFELVHAGDANHNARPPQALAKRVAMTLYRDLQRSIDEPLPISHLTNYLKQKLTWEDDKIRKIHEQMDLTSNTMEFQDIVEYLSSNKPIASELEAFYLNHPVASMPRVPSFSELRGQPNSVSGYFDRAAQIRFSQNLPNIQQGVPMPMIVPPQLYFYDQSSQVAVHGTTSGTVYENPLFTHGAVYANQPSLSSPIQHARPHSSHSTSARRSIDGISPRHEDEDISDEEIKSDSSSQRSGDYRRAHAKSTEDEMEPQQEVKPMDMDAWVRCHNGNRVIKKLLIANNGIAAVKCIKYVREWCYQTFGDMNAIHFVCMATPEDIQSNAEYIRMADEVVQVPGGGNNYNYANVTIIVTIATQTKCDAVWPGWGHASEYPSLPRELAKNDIGWIGPDADAMYASGDKIMSTLIAQHAKVPTVPWSGSGIKVKYRRGDMTEVEAGFKKSCVTTLQQAVECANKIGYPVMIKASEGGGGKGIRKCESEEEMESAYNQVVNEVPGSPIFLMKLASNARHLEVQLLADTWGNAIALFGRDCSMQRRHQKIIEEGPIINVDEKLLLEMEASAVALAKSVQRDRSNPRHCLVVHVIR